MSRELKTGLRAILDRARAGEAFTVTECGEPVADVPPGRFASRQKVMAAIGDTKAAMSGTDVSDALLNEYTERGCG